VAVVVVMMDVAVMGGGGNGGDGGGSGDGDGGDNLAWRAFFHGETPGLPNRRGLLVPKHLGNHQSR
jgi:hypothetical protein